MLDFPNAFDWYGSTRAARVDYLIQKQINGFSYGDIATELNAPRSTITTFARMHLGGNKFYRKSNKIAPLAPSNEGRLAITLAITEHASIKVPMPESSIRYVTRRHGIQCAAIVDGIDETVRDNDGLRPHCGAPITRGQYCAFHASIYLTGKSK